MESPNKKKLRSGVRSTVGGGLGGNTYKTASPYNIKTNNMTNTNGLSPLMQAAVGGAVQTIPGQNITRTEQGFSFSPGAPEEPGSEIPGGVGGPMEMQSPVKNYKKGYYGIK